MCCATSQGENNITEAQRMADYTIDQSVLADDIIVEDQEYAKLIIESAIDHLLAAKGKI